MAERRKKKKSGCGSIVILGLIILAGIGILIFLGKDIVKDKITQKASEQVTQTALEGILNSIDDPDAAEKAKEIVDNMDEEDKEEIQDIVGKYVDGETVSDVMKIIGDGINADTIEEAEEYLEGSVSEEDKQKLMDLYGKYVSP